MLLGNCLVKLSSVILNCNWFLVKLYLGKNVLVELTSVYLIIFMTANENRLSEMTASVTNSPFQN